MEFVKTGKHDEVYFLAFGLSEELGPGWVYTEPEERVWTASIEHGSGMRVFVESARQPGRFVISANVSARYIRYVGYGWKHPEMTVRGDREVPEIARQVRAKLLPEVEDCLVKCKEHERYAIEQRKVWKRHCGSFKTLVGDLLDLWQEKEEERILTMDYRANGTDFRFHVGNSGIGISGNISHEDMRVFAAMLRVLKNKHGKEGGA